MVNKDKKITVSAFDKAMKEQTVPNVTERWCGSDIVIKHTISISQMLEFVDRVVSNCFSDSEFVPEIKDMMIRAELLTQYANFTLPKDIEHMYSLLYQTDAVAIVNKHIDTTQFNIILDAIDKKIDYICKTNISSLEKQIQQLSVSLDEISQNATKAFSNLSSDDIVKLIGAASNGNIDEQKLVKAFLEQKEVAENEHFE